MLQSKKAQAVKVEHCNTRIGDRDIFVAEGSFSKRCPRKNSELTFVSNQEISKLSNCIKQLAVEKNIFDVNVLPVKQMCDKKCVDTNCSLHYVIDLGNYVTSCKSKTFQQQQFSFCADSKNNGDSNYIVIVIVFVLAFVVLLVVGVLTYFYRRYKTSNNSETVSRITKSICFSIVFGHCFVLIKKLRVIFYAGK